MPVFEKVPGSPRLVNHFTVGADPEFGFVDALGRYIHAETFGLNTMQAFGCDMCGRIAELRAYPSRFVVDVVASLIDALRWIPQVHEGVNAVSWKAVTTIEKDGCGGHLHVGRKRCMKKDTQILDETLKLLLNTGALDSTSFQTRAENTKYGRYGDVRSQNHGYEYRTTPTWLASPWLAYLVLVVNKLILHQGRPSAYDAKKPKDAIKELLLQFRGMDDDAAIAYEALERYGMPKQEASDFKSRWGVAVKMPIEPVLDVSKYFFPSVIKPEARTREELVRYLVKGEALPLRVPLPTWEPFKLPKGFYRPYVQAHTLGHLPDTGMDLVCHVPTQITYGREFRISSSMVLPAPRIKKALTEAMPPEAVTIETARDSRPYLSIMVPQAFKDSREQCKLLRELLGDSTLFPSCNYEDFHKADWSRWDGSVVEVPVKALGRKL